MTEVINLKYTTKAYKAYSFKGILKEYSSKKLHKHIYHEILLIKNGVSILADGNIRQPLFGTSLGLIPSNILHRSLVVGQGLEYMVLFIHKSLFQLNSRNIKIFNPGELVLALFNKLCSINNTELAKGFSGECLNLFLSAIKEDIKNESKVVRLPESKNTNNLKIMDFIYKNYNRKLNISDFKKIAPYTARHISRIFSNELKIGIFEYLRLYRILMASIEISKDDKNITDIAFECGYESLSSFYKDFKTFFGIAPKELRARIKLK
jgi:AraC-like DNA-binding protein